MRRCRVDAGFEGQGSLRGTGSAAHHVYLMSSKSRAGTRNGEEEQERRMRPPVNLRRYEPLCGPPVRLHPDTQRPVVWTSPAHLEHYEGYSAAESRELLEALLLPGTTSSAVYAHCWEQGDVVVWDNRRTIHSTTKSDGTSALLYQV